MGPEVMLGPEVTLGAVVLAVLLTPRAHTKPHSAFAPAAGSSPVPPLCPAGVAFVLQRVLAASPPGNGKN